MSEVLSSLLASAVVGASSVLILLTIQLKRRPYTAFATASRESAKPETVVSPFSRQ